MLKLEDLAELAEAHSKELNCRVAEFSIGGQPFAFNSSPAIMGVVNLSTDSWYRESVCLSTEAAIQRGEVLHAQGAQIIDVGAESTLAHAARAGDALQSSKLIPVIQGFKERSILVSAETYSTEVALACLQAGASVLNLTGVPSNDEIYRLVADHDAALILCYVQGPNVREVGDLHSGEDFIAALRAFFECQIERAVSAGVSKIFIDPGLGFYYRNLQDSGLRVRHQMSVFLNTFRLRTLGFPVCHALPHAFEFFREDVRSAEPFFAVLATLGKTDLFRTHEVSRVRAVMETMHVFDPRC
jgi:dihydropteroate synthase